MPPRQAYQHRNRASMIPVSRLSALTTYIRLHTIIRPAAPPSSVLAAATSSNIDLSSGHFWEHAQRESTTTSPVTVGYTLKLAK